MPFTQWIVGTSTTVALALGGWGLLGTVSNSERIAVVETEIKRLERIENKIDWLVDERVLDYQRRRPQPRAEAPRFEAPRAPEPEPRPASRSTTPKQSP